MFEQRKALYAQLEQARNSKVLCYVTGDRPNQEAQISADVFDLFVNHLDVIGDVQKLVLCFTHEAGIL